MNYLRSVVVTTVAIATLAAGHAFAQTKFPTRPIRLIVAFTAGGTPDTLARQISPRMSETFGQPLVIENRPGAGGTLAAGMVARAAPDGYTLLATSAAITINAVMQPTLPYNPLKDFSGVASLGFSTSALIVAPTLGVKSVKELIALAHAQPGKILFGSAGAGSSTQLSSERFRAAAGFKAVHVAFKGLPEFIIEVASGRVHFGIASLGIALPMIKDGRLLPLAVVPARTPLLPDLPALSEIVPGASRDGSQMWLAPAGTPRPILQQISREIARIFALPEVRERLHNLAFQPAPTTPEDTERMLRDDFATFTRIVRDAGMRPK
jgi:tripartite-type tricarboxylate transporter receptor subunit TctC